MGNSFFILSLSLLVKELKYSEEKKINKSFCCGSVQTETFQHRKHRSTSCEQLPSGNVQVPWLLGKV